MRITYVNPLRGSVLAKDIPVRTFFSATIAGAYEGLFLRTYQGIVYLDDPKLTWTISDSGIGPTISDYHARSVEVRVLD